MKRASQTPFSSNFFQFLVELKFNNERAWFHKNKARYEEMVKSPFQSFVTELTPKVTAIHKAYRYVKLFRVHRDTRFSGNKAPYKTHAAAQFRHYDAAESVHAPGFYLHLEPGESFAGGGVWMPEPEHIKAIRERISLKDKTWIAIKRSKLPLSDSDSLKRPPKGYDPLHPLLEDLKRRNFITWADFSDKQVLASDFQDQVITAFRKANTLIRFLNEAIAL